jgi:hypothetical protein
MWTNLLYHPGLCSVNLNRSIQIIQMDGRSISLLVKNAKVPMVSDTFAIYGWRVVARPH